MIVFALLICLVSNTFGKHEAAEYVDLIELNHQYDTRGRLVFDQVIFWERTPEQGRFQVRAWCMVDDRELLNRRPVKNEVNGMYQVDSYDADIRLRRTITSRLFRESWTQLDPERDNKKVHDERLRVGLIRRIEVTQ